MLQILHRAEHGLKIKNSDMVRGQRVRLLSNYLNEFDDKLPREEIVNLMHSW